MKVKLADGTRAPLFTRAGRRARAAKPANLYDQIYFVLIRNVVPLETESMGYVLPRMECNDMPF